MFFSSPNLPRSVFYLSFLYLPLNHTTFPSQLSTKFTSFSVSTLKYEWWRSLSTKVSSFLHAGPPSTTHMLTRWSGSPRSPPLSSTVRQGLDQRSFLCSGGRPWSPDVILITHTYLPLCRCRHFHLWPPCPSLTPVPSGPFSQTLLEA